MAENSESFTAYFGIEVETMLDEDKIHLIGELCDTLSAARLRQVRDLAEQKRQAKLEDAKLLVIEEMREKLAELDLDIEDVLATIPRRRRRESVSSLPAEYQGPNGETWSGRGVKPKWARELEDANVNLEAFRVQDAE